MPAAAAGAALIALTACSGGEEPEAVVPPAIAATVDVPEPVIEEGPETVATPAVIEEISEQVSIKPQAEVTAAITEGAPSGSGGDLLQIVDVAHCLNVRALPYIEAEIVGCIPLGAKIEAGYYAIRGGDGVTWRGLGWPFWGFASDRYLEGPEAKEIRSLPPYVAPEEFPDVAVVGEPYKTGWLPRPSDALEVASKRLDRIYRRSDGEVTRETLITLRDMTVAYPDAFSDLGESEDVLLGTPEVAPDGFRMNVGVCTRMIDFENFCADTAALFASTDGGVTWSHVGSGSITPDHLRLDRQDTPPIPSDLLHHYLPGDDPPDDWPADRHLFYSLESIGPSYSPAVIVQRGPFLRVVDVADCLPVLADRSLDAEELACAAERVLLTDLGEASEVDGRTWHRVRTPSGVVGWADGRGLE